MAASKVKSKPKGLGLQIRQEIEKDLEEDFNENDYFDDDFDDDFQWSSLQNQNSLTYMSADRKSRRDLDPI